MLGEGELKLSCYAVTAFFQLPCFELHILNCDHRGISDERLESSMKAGQILICMKSNFKLDFFFGKGVVIKLRNLLQYINQEF